MKPEDLNRCVKCGTCRSLCPVFRVTGREGSVARGKIAVLQELVTSGEGRSRETRALLDACVVCGSCQHVCPLDVPFMDIVTAARAEGFGLKQVPAIKRTILAALASNPAWEGIRALLAGLPEDSGLTFKLPVIQRAYPHPDEPLIHDQTVRHEEPDAPVHRGDLLFFPGCATRFLMGDLGRRTVSVLRRLGFGVFLDGRFRCCGFPHLTAGDRDRTEELVRHNTRLIETYRDRITSITTGCATCGSALKRHYELSVPVRDINEIVIDALPPDLTEKLDMAVLYHAPCHLAKHQHIRSEPESILNRIVDVLPVENPDACCGFGGSFSVTEHRLSREIGDRRTQDFKQSVENSGKRDPVVVTSCPGCMMQLADGLARNELRYKVKHIIDIVYESMEAKDAESDS